MLPLYSCSVSLIAEVSKQAPLASGGFTFKPFPDSKQPRLRPELELPAIIVLVRGRDALYSISMKSPHSSLSSSNFAVCYSNLTCRLLRSQNPCSCCELLCSVSILRCIDGSSDPGSELGAEKTYIMLVCRADEIVSTVSLPFAGFLSLYQLDRVALCSLTIL